jgi:hypothetical protein
MASNSSEANSTAANSSEANSTAANSSEANSTAANSSEANSTASNSSEASGPATGKINIKIEIPSGGNVTGELAQLLHVEVHSIKHQQGGDLEDSYCHEKIQ